MPQKNKSIACIRKSGVRRQTTQFEQEMFFHQKYDPHEVSLCNVYVNFILTEKMLVREFIFEVLQYLFSIIMWIQPIFSFTGLVT